MKVAMKRTMRLRKLGVGVVAVAASVAALASPASAATGHATTPVVAGTQSEVWWNYNGSAVTGYLYAHYATSGVDVPTHWYNSSVAYVRTTAKNGSCAAIAGYYNGASNYATNVNGAC